MKTVDDLLNKNVPLVAIDKRMDKLKNKVVFKEKLEEANRVLPKMQLPKNMNTK